MYVLPEADTPSWHFSLGLYTTFQQPEVIVFGLAENVGKRLLNLFADHLRAGGRLEIDALYPDLLEGVECTLKPVAALWYRPLLGWANWYHRHQAYPVLQCIWPDHERHFPWHPDFRADWRWAQPLLWEETPERAGMQPILDSLDRGPPEGAV